MNYIHVLANRIQRKGFIYPTEGLNKQKNVYKPLKTHITKNSFTWVKTYFKNIRKM